MGGWRKLVFVPGACALSDRKAAADQLTEHRAASVGARRGSDNDT